MDSMVYPTLEIVEGRGIIPRICLPRNYKTLIPLFYEEGRRKTVETYAKELEEYIAGGRLETKIRLQWNEEKGLINISVGTAGLDLNERGWPSFQEHNLGGHFSFAASAVATKYISELLKSRPSPN